MHTHVVVKDTPPPSHVMTVGRLYPIGPEPVFSTYVPEYAQPESREDRIAALEAELAELKSDEDETEVEAKVVRRGRRPSPKATEGAETK